VLEIVIPKTEFYDEKTEMFVDIDEQTLQLEHSLVSVSKWEAKWHKAFLKKQEKTNEEFKDYIRCMTLNNVDPLVYSVLTVKNYNDINEYINAKMTASYISEKTEDGAKASDTVTSDLIYYWMVALQIPFECQYWHLDKLLTLVKICNIKNKQPSKKKGKPNLAHRSALNAQRRAHAHSKG